MTHKKLMCVEIAHKKKIYLKVIIDDRVYLIDTARNVRQAIDFKGKATYICETSAQGNIVHNIWDRTDAVKTTKVKATKTTKTAVSKATKDKASK